MDSILRARLVADVAHGACGQVRKYTGEPYIVHPEAVARTVYQHGGTDNMVAAALLHDVVEDTHISILMIERMFGDTIATLVSEVTDQFTKEKFPDWSRSKRKSLEAQRYVFASHGGKTIKLADMIDNTKSIGEHDPKFLKTYGPEKRYLLEALKGGDERLWKQADEILKGYGY